VTVPEVAAFLVAVLCAVGARRAKDERSRTAWAVAFLAACGLLVIAGIAAAFMGG
jgi:heme A synthase